MVDTKQHLTPEDNLVLSQLRNHGEAWIVGGWVRDKLLMKKTKDLDNTGTVLYKGYMTHEHEFRVYIHHSCAHT